MIINHRNWFIINWHLHFRRSRSRSHQLQSHITHLDETNGDRSCDRSATKKRKQNRIVESSRLRDAAVAAYVALVAASTKRLGIRLARRKEMRLPGNELTNGRDVDNQSWISFLAWPPPTRITATARGGN